MEMADATRVLVERFGYVLDEELFDDEQVRANAEASRVSEEQARGRLIAAALECGRKVVSAVGSHGGAWLSEAVELSRDEKTLTIAAGTEVCFYDTTSYECIKKFNLGVIEANGYGVNSATLDPERKVFVAGGGNFWVYVHDYETGARRRHRSGRPAALAACPSRCERARTRAHNHAQALTRAHRCGVARLAAGEELLCNKGAQEEILLVNQQYELVYQRLYQVCP